MAPKPHLRQRSPDDSKHKEFSAERGPSPRWPPSASMSVIVPVLNDGIDTVVWCSEELEGVISSIYTRFRQYVQNAKQSTARFLNCFQSR